MSQSINISVDYFDCPMVIRLVGLLGKGSEVLPIKLWSYTGKHHAEDGRLTDYSPQEIESCIKWWGERGVAVAALLKVGVLKLEGETYVVANWLEDQGHLPAFKVRAKKAAKARWDKIAGSNASSNAQASDKHCPNEPTNQLRPPSPRPAGERRGKSTAGEEAKAIAEGLL